MEKEKSAVSDPAWKKLLEWAAAPLSGGLLVLCFHPYNLHYFAWIALLPLLWTLGRATPRAAALRGYLFGVGFLGLLLWWFSVCRYPASLGYVFSVSLFSLLFVPWAWAARGLIARGGAFRLLLTAALWVSIELVASQGTFAFPWWSLGNTQVENLLIAQSASIGGSYLISFEIVLANLFLYSALRRRLATEKLFWCITFAVALAGIARGGVLLARDAKPEDGIKLALIQPSFAQDEKTEGSIAGEMFTTHVDMTAEAVRAERPDVVVWSETVTYRDWIAKKGVNLDSMVSLLKKYNIMLVAGVYEFADEIQYNSVVVMDGKNGVIDDYRKMHLVPFSEKVPHRKLIEKLSPALGRWVHDNIWPEDVGEGERFTVFDTDHGKFSTMVCFESALPAISARMAREGAEALFIVTNDAWFKKSPGAGQHASLAVMRAIENRRWVAQAANSGTSIIIGPYGRVSGRTRVFEKQILYGTIGFISEKTIYTRYGDFFAFACLAFSLAGLLYLYVARRRRNGLL